VESSRIYTYISLSVEDPLKGDARRSLVVRQVGGSAGGRTTWIAGMPQFKSGDSVIVFLRNRGDGTFDITGLNQGKYDIVNGYAVANVSGVTLLDPTSGALSDAGFVDRVRLETLKAKIRELAR
jgi:hypothetical protein